MPRSCPAGCSWDRPRCRARSSIASRCCPSAGAPATASGSCGPPKTGCGRPARCWPCHAPGSRPPSTNSAGACSAATAPHRAARPRSWPACSKSRAVPARPSPCGSGGTSSCRPSCGSTARMPVASSGRSTATRTTAGGSSAAGRSTRSWWRSSARIATSSTSRAPGSWATASSRAIACSRSWPTPSSPDSSARSWRGSVPRRSRTTGRRSCTSRVPPIPSMRRWPAATAGSPRATG